MQMQDWFPWRWLQLHRYPSIFVLLLVDFRQISITLKTCECVSLSLFVWLMYKNLVLSPGLTVKSLSRSTYLKRTPIGESLLTSLFTFFLITIRLNSLKPWPYIRTKCKSWKSWLSWTICAIFSSLQPIVKTSAPGFCWQFLWWLCLFPFWPFF